MDESIDQNLMTRSDTTYTVPAGPQLVAGSMFGVYRIVRSIGRGGMGHVYEAFDAKLNRTIALKTMLPKLAATETDRNRFLAEARTLAAVSNDHVVTIHDVGIQDGLPYLVMEYLTGESLDARLNRGSVPILQILKLAREITNGLVAAHQLGITHRDVKPDNVMIDDRYDRAILIDFGLAHTPQSTQGSNLTGTPLYMSPEQLRSETVDPRTDLFSLGVVLYRLCTGLVPFLGSNLADWRRQLLSDEPALKVDVANPSIPPPLVDLIHRLLSKKVEDRPRNAAAVEWELIQIFQSVLSFTHSGMVPAVNRTPMPMLQPTLIELQPQTQIVSAPEVAKPASSWLPILVSVTALVILGVLGTVALWPRPQPDDSRSLNRTQPLFDGQTLAGWHGVEGKIDRWTVRDGVLVGTPKSPDQYLLTDREFTDFVLGFEFRWKEKGGHTTVILRAKDSGPILEKDSSSPTKERVTGLELNLGDETEPDPTGKQPNPLYASGGLFRLKGPSLFPPNLPIGEWNQVVVTSERSRLTVVWNGVTTFAEDLDKHAPKANLLPALARTKGSIALRTHLGKAIEFRNIVITPIER
jgi:serine/threonine protein kinase